LLYHQDGVIYCYENLSKNLTLVESLEFELINCVIEGVRGYGAEVIVPPGETYLLNIVVLDPEFEYSAKYKKGHYEIKTVR
jgi:hypothetical protein